MKNDLFSTLHKEHEEVKTIFQKLKNQNSEEERKQSLKQLESAIIPHMRGEEHVIYPKLEELAESKGIAFEAMEEHLAVRLIMEELYKMPTNDERFSARANVIMEMVDHHVQEEEGEIFKQLKEHFKPEQLETMLEKFEQEKKTAKEKLVSRQ